MSEEKTTDNTVIRDKVPPPPPPVMFMSYSVGSAAIVYIIYTIWQWIMCGCGGL